MESDLEGVETNDRDGRDEALPAAYSINTEALATVREPENADLVGVFEPRPIDMALCFEATLIRLSASTSDMDTSVARKEDGALLFQERGKAFLRLISERRLSRNITEDAHRLDCRSVSRSMRL